MPAGTGHIGLATSGEATMPTDTIVMIIVVVAIFGIFMGVLGWAERTTRSLPRR